MNSAQSRKYYKALDAKIGSNRLVISSSRDLARLLFARLEKETRLEKEGGEPAGACAISDLVSNGALVVGDGYRTVRSELSEHGYRIVRVADLQDGEISRVGIDYISEKYSNQIGAKKAVPEDIVLSTKGTIGRVAMVRRGPDLMAYSPQVCFFRVAENRLLDRFYLRYWFESSDFQSQAAHRMDNSEMAPYINLADIRSLQVPLPPIESQRAMAMRWRALDEQVGALDDENWSLANLRDALLPELISGKLRVKDAEKRMEEVV